MHTQASGAGEQTFIFADLAGYVALTEAHGDERAADAAARFAADVRALLDDYDADDIKAIGDALLLRGPLGRGPHDRARPPGGPYFATNG